LAEDTLYPKGRSESNILKYYILFHPLSILPQTKKKKMVQMIINTDSSGLDVEIRLDGTNHFHKHYNLGDDSAKARDGSESIPGRVTMIFGSIGCGGNPLYPPTWFLGS
jgi:hypothetical protein